VAETQASHVPPSPGPGPTQRTRETTIAGLCYLAVIVGGLFAQGMVRQSLIVPGDASATTLAIFEDETLWRLGIAVHLLYLVPALTMKLLVCALFRSTEPTLTRLALVFGISAVSVEAVSLTFLYVPLALPEASIAAVGSPTLVYLGTQLFAAGFAFSLVLFAGFCIGVGALILRSRRMPGTIGWLMVVAGVCYIINTIAMIVSPDLFRLLFPAILAPALLAELSLALWLLLKGIAIQPD